MPSWVTRLSSRTPLRIKLIAASLALVALALVAVSVASVSAMRGYLLDKTDRQLTGVARIMARAITQPGAFQTKVPVTGQFVYQVRDSTGKTVASSPQSIWRDPEPEPIIPQDPNWLAAHAEKAVTVNARSGDMRWRIHVEPVDGGYVVVGTDLGDVARTAGRLVGVEIVVGSIVLVLVAGLGVAIVRASLRPLVNIENTAEAIAAGDLSRRVPDADPRTEVGRLGNALNGMLTQIETAFHAQSRSEATARESEGRMRRFVADASHELRTPLSVIRGFAEYYRQREDVPPDELDRLIGRVEDEAARMGILVDDLLLLARLDQQRPLAQLPVDLLALAADSVQDARVVDGEREITLSVRSGSAFIVTGDEVRLRQVIGNLVNNALRHTPAGTPVEVVVRSGMLGDSPAAVLEVVDSGPGMPAEQAERVFERFYRADPARSRGGTGLGLAIVAGLVEAHGGSVSVDTAPGEGATFRVLLPLDPDAIEADPIDPIESAHS
ncbi:HAMP domain-containing sensor histidine kinase [Actinoallomurus bryophytorum]|uniref:histidine kinase n=1 Tax=Actinoallomurus bryophytorum TaxID=1490222 RepID=A0A543CFX3_9ACTN|nr:HAMP domain-containing sensor histidine kinase [Actinoallomurus bryophytorum]TQL95807.1 two-component system OmpR family sensor kinase [Actinoallomurus bryophytorum]